MPLPPWPLPGAQVRTRAPPLPKVTPRSPQGSGSSVPSPRCNKTPSAAAGTRGAWLAVSPFWGRTSQRSLRGLQDVSFLGTPRPSARGHVRAASAIPAVASPCASAHRLHCARVGARPGGRQHVRGPGFRVFFLGISLRDVPCASRRIASGALRSRRSPQLTSPPISWCGCWSGVRAGKSPSPPPTRGHAALRGGRWPRRRGGSYSGGFGRGGVSRVPVSMSSP